MIVNNWFCEKKLQYNNSLDNLSQNNKSPLNKNNPTKQWLITHKENYQLCTFNIIIRAITLNVIYHRIVKIYTIIHLIVYTSLTLERLEIDVNFFCMQN